MTYVVGLTGGIGSGKSTVADLFAELGVPIIDADIVARQVVEKGSPLLAKIVEHFGSQVLLANFELNRTALRQIVFDDPKQKAWLEALLHPAIREEMIRQLDSVQQPYALWVVPLLIENGLIDFCDRVVVVDVESHIQLERASQRDHNCKQVIRNIIASQVSRQTRLEYADDVIDNNFPLEEGFTLLKQRVQQLHQCYLQLALQGEYDGKGFVCNKG
ncbi:dephospho-CoA kinase [Nicoletella semolina]|uniref:Dephospho-CoA kinase n=1 Tax=Nicoletella semolina TaxID=271160 RepID=A0A4R2NA71_9PAST|nr:dephospho-CoA kinase [Nicoletella semolina]MDH2925414.1 dephospho-CoA kinase [Nicoletella semolina]TCP17894.1 dephospho-CoA kinase [Nicoletella semolina]